MSDPIPPGFRDDAIPEFLRTEWTERIAAPVVNEQQRSAAALLFRIGPEWLALPTAFVERVVDSWAVHTIPHRRTSVVLGVGGTGGDLILTVSLGALLGMRPDAVPSDRRRTLVLCDGRARSACPVDEVYGTHRYHPDECSALPPTAVPEHGVSIGLLSWRGRTAGLLDAVKLFEALDRSIA